MTLAVSITNGNPAERILVIAPNYPQFSEWCRAHKIDPRARNVTSASDASRIRGYAHCRYVLVGYPETAEGARLANQLEIMKRLGAFTNAEITEDTARA